MNSVICILQAMQMAIYKEFTEKARNYTYEAMLSYNKTWKSFNVSASAGANYAGLRI